MTAGDSTQTNTTEMEVQAELDSITKLQSALVNQMANLTLFTKQEERRLGIQTVDEPPDLLHGIERTVQQLVDGCAETMLEINNEFKKCKTIIQKLHMDCDAVAKGNCDILEKLQECDTEIRTHLGWKARCARPQTTHDIFMHLVNDIKKLSNKYSRHLLENADIKGPCLRLIKQHQQWVCDRMRSLKAATFNDNTAQSQEVITNTELDQQVEIVDKDTLVRGLKDFNRDLQRYIYYEGKVFEEYRRLVKMRQLQKKSHPIALPILRNIDSKLSGLETLDNQVMVQRIRAAVDTMTDEYEECLYMLLKYDGNADFQSSTDQPNPPVATTSVSNINTSSTNEEQGPSDMDISNATETHLSTAISIAASSTIAIRQSKLWSNSETLTPNSNSLVALTQSLLLTLENLQTDHKLLKSQYKDEIRKKGQEYALSLKDKQEEINSLKTLLQLAMMERDKYMKLSERKKKNRKK